MKLLLPFLSAVLCLQSFPVLAQSYPGASLTLVASDAGRPVQLTHAGDGSGRLFVADLEGRVLLIEDGTVAATPLLDLTHRVSFVAESGLLGLALHPHFPEDGRFFVSFVEESEGDIALVLSEFVLEGGSAVGEGRVVLSIPKTSFIHNGGQVAFGPDGYLYMSTGDGGRPAGETGEDPFRNAQDPMSLLGKILRLDVDGETPYGIPPDNPFVGDEEYRPEIWALGFRNPWRFSFDRESGRLFVGDVGAVSWEEIDLVKKGMNYGWSEVEGLHCYRSGCDPEPFEPPIFEYSREENDRSVSGGFVYRGEQPTQLYGRYLFSDHVSGRVWWLEEEPQGRWSRHELVRAPFNVPALGEDEAGELYLLDLVGRRIYRLDFHSRMIFPHFADGPSPEGRVETELILTNPHPHPVKGIIKWTTHMGAGASVVLEDGEGSSFDFELAAHTSRKWTTTGEQVELLRGWVEVQSETELLGSLYLAERAGTNPWEIELDSSRPGTDFVLAAEVDTESGIDTALAVANPSPNERPVVEIVAEADGSPAELFEVELTPSIQGAAFLSEILELPAGWSGMVTIRSSHNIVVSALQTRNGRPHRTLDVAALP